MKFLYAVAILSGTMIGAGLFALPQITTEVGIGVMTAYLIILGLVSVCIHYFFGELALKTKDHIRLPGFAEIHLGSWARKIALFSGVLGLLGAILAYIILGGQFLEGLFGGIFGGTADVYTLIYFAIGSAMIFFGIKAVEKIELLGVVGFLMVLVLVLFRGWEIIDPSQVFEVGAGLEGDLFLPYGAVLFSLWGAALVPEMEEELAGEKEKLKWTFPVGIAIAVLIYLFFIFVIVGITGAETTEEAILGLQDQLGNTVVNLALIFGLLATFTSFLTLGLTLKKFLWYDLGLNKHFSWAITTFIPLALFFAGVENYIHVISTIGAMLLAIDAILITLMYQKYKPLKYRLITYPIILMFVLGMVYKIYYNKDLIFSLF